MGRNEDGNSIMVLVRVSDWLLGVVLVSRLWLERCFKSSGKRRRCTEVLHQFGVVFM
jgi:hypothetical protein